MEPVKRQLSGPYMSDTFSGVLDDLDKSYMSKSFTEFMNQLTRFINDGRFPQGYEVHRDFANGWENLKDVVKSIGYVISDAEDKEVCNEAVSYWLTDLKDVVYGIEDLLDDIHRAGFISMGGLGMLNPLLDERMLELNPRKRLLKFLHRVNYNYYVLKSLQQEVDLLGLGYENNLPGFRYENKTTTYRRWICWGQPTGSMADPSKVCGRDSDHEAVIGFLTSEVVEITRFTTSRFTTTTHSGTRFTTSSDASSQHGRVEFVEQYLDVQKIPSDPLDGAASGSRDKSDRRAAERTYGSFKLLAKRASRYATLGWNGILGKNAGGQVDNSTASSSRVEQRYFPDSGSGDDESEMLARGGKSPSTSIEEVSGDNLSSTQRGVNEIPIVAIVGMPGIGKTTLAQLVFNDNRIHQWFELRSWVWVPYPFQMKDVMKDIVNSIQFHGDPQSLAAGESLASLQQNLLVKIGKQKLLLVLDNVWSGHDIWETLLVPLQSAAPGCRIIVTTRDKKVANALNAEFILPIAELSEEDCWKVVRKTALPHDTSLDSELERVGWKIAERCKGLPLAAKTFGGILRPSVNMQSWEEISRREIWNLPEGGERLIKSLLLSYQNLSPQPNQCSAMMRCFAYCSIFPKGHMFQRERLVLLWIAEGFVKDVGASTEAIADGHFRDLVSKFLLRESNCNESNPPTFMMHDMIHDLARYVMGGIGFLEHPRDTQEISSRTRHFTFRQSKTDNEGSLRILSELNCLRTFLPLPSKQFDGRSNCCLSKTVLASLIERGSHLRVLSLANYEITDLPDPKGRLKYLRYLDLSNTLICSLPKPVFGLGFLRTLWLTDCVHLTSLPVDLGSQLPRLRHLDIRGCKLQRPLQERRGLKIVHSRRGLNMLPLR